MIKMINNDFHSQGTIIGTGAFNILSNRGVEINNTQKINAYGPAVYQSTWEKTASKITTPTRFVISKDSPLGEPGSTLYSNINYTHDENDGVRKITAPRTSWDPFVGIYNMITTPERHSIGNYKK